MRIRYTTGNSSLTRIWRKWKSRYVSTQYPIVIGGCPRSGTTLTRIILDSHPNIACGPESRLLTGGLHAKWLANRFELSLDEIIRLRKAARDHAHFVELFLTQYAVKQGKTRWAEKTPTNVRHLPYIFRHFPNARFVHVVRDGRDVVCSLRTHPKYRVVDGTPVPTNIRRPLRSCIRDWLRDTRAGMSWRGHPHYMELRYEDLVRDTESTLKRLCEFIGEPWNPKLLEYHLQQSQSRDPIHFSVSTNAIQSISTGAIGRWRKDLSEQEIHLFHRMAGQRLLEFGYPVEEGSQ
jgi:hypothetical protein